MIRRTVLALVSTLLVASWAANSPAIEVPRRAAPGDDDTPATMDSLLRALEDTVSIVRMRTLSAISERRNAGDREAGALLRVALRDPDHDVRYHARYELTRLPAPTHAGLLDGLEAAMADPDTSLRGNAAAALGSFAAESDRALPLILGAAPGTECPILTIRTGVNEGLEEVDRLWPGQLPGLVDFFARCDPRLRFHAGDALATSGTAAVPYLLPLLESPDWNVRANAARTLGLIGESGDRVAPALAARLADPDFRVRAYALRALGALGTPAAHTACVQHSGVETHGPEQSSLVLGSSAMRPDTAIVAVAATYRAFRPPLEPFEDDHLVEVTSASEQRIYLCDLDARTVRALARIDVPEELRSGFALQVRGWRGDSIVVQFTGRPAYKPNRSRGETRHAWIDLDGGVHALPDPPARLAQPRGYRDTPSGRHFLQVSVDRDEVARYVDHGLKETVFRVDPERAELLPAGP